MKIVDQNSEINAFWISIIFRQHGETFF